MMVRHIRVSNARLKRRRDTWRSFQRYDLLQSNLFELWRCFSQHVAEKRALLSQENLFEMMKSCKKAQTFILRFDLIQWARFLLWGNYRLAIAWMSQSICLQHADYCLRRSSDQNHSVKQRLDSECQKADNYSGQVESKSFYSFLKMRKLW